MTENASSPLLTERQRRLAGFAISLLAIVSSIALLVLLFYAFGRMVGFFSSVLWPLAVAGVLALILSPVVNHLEQRLGIRRIFAVAILFSAFVLAATALLLAILPPVVVQILDFVTYAPMFWDNAVTYTKEHYPSWIHVWDRMMTYPAFNSVVDSLKSEASRIPAMLMPSLRALTQGITGVFGFLTHIAVVPIYLFFFLLGKQDPVRDVPSHLPFLSPAAREDVMFLLREFLAIVTAFFRGQIVIGLIMGALLATGFTVIGLKFGLFIGLALGILNIVPYLGTIIGLLITLPLAFFQPGGGLQLLGLVLLIYIVVQNIEGWFLTPRIMGQRTGLHPVAIIVAILFWGTALDGLLGMILAIPLTAFFVSAWRFAKRRYFRQCQTEQQNESPTASA